MTDLLELQTIEVAGSSTAMGEALGEGLRALITGLVERRSAAAAEYLAERQVTAVDLVTLGGECLHVLRGWDAPSYDEHCATANGAAAEAPCALCAAAGSSSGRSRSHASRSPPGIIEGPRIMAGSHNLGTTSGYIDLESWWWKLGNIGA